MALKIDDSQSGDTRVVEYDLGMKFGFRWNATTSSSQDGAETKSLSGTLAVIVGEMDYFLHSEVVKIDGGEEDNLFFYIQASRCSDLRHNVASHAVWEFIPSFDELGHFLMDCLVVDMPEAMDLAERAIGELTQSNLQRMIDAIPQPLPFSA